MIRHAKGLPFWTVLHNQASRLEGNGEFLGDLDQFLEAVGGVGFLFAAELAYLFQKEERKERREASQECRTEIVILGLICNFHVSPRNHVMQP